jgi:hypothetical protein
MMVAGGVSGPFIQGIPRKVQTRGMQRRYRSRYRRENEAVLILVLFLLLIMVLLFFS